jgi:hypothetical protein
MKSIISRVGEGAAHSRWQAHRLCALLPTLSDFASTMATTDRVGKGGKQIVPTAHRLGRLCPPYGPHNMIALIGCSREEL